MENKKESLKIDLAADLVKVFRGGVQVQHGRLARMATEPKFDSNGYEVGIKGYRDSKGLFRAFVRARVDSIYEVAGVSLSSLANDCMRVAGLRFNEDRQGFFAKSEGNHHAAAQKILAKGVRACLVAAKGESIEARALLEVIDGRAISAEDRVYHEKGLQRLFAAPPEKRQFLTDEINEAKAAVALPTFEELVAKFEQAEIESAMPAAMATRKTASL